MDIMVTMAIALLIGYLLYVYSKWKSFPPGPWGLPIVGYLPWIDKDKPYITLTELARRYGPIYSVSMGSVSTVVVSDAQLIKNALSRDVFSARANLYLTHGIMKGYGLIAAEGEKWKEQRRFVSSFLKGLGVVKVGAKRALMEKKILEGVREAMLSRLDGKAEDPHNILLHSIGNVINLVVFGKTWAYDDPQWIWLRRLLADGIKLIGIVGPVNFLPFLRWWPGYNRLLRYLKDGKSETHKVYKEISDGSSTDGEHLLANYKAAMANSQGRHFEEKQMFHVLADMFGAGTDTTLSTLRWFLLFMAVNPSIQSRVREELEKALNGRQDPTLEDMENLPYTMACLFETQRIRVITPLGIPHGTWEETDLGGYRIPRGAMIMVLQWAVHMDPEVWDDPESFRPERFIDSEGKVIKNHHNFMPFQCGKRICLGEEMAKMMLFLFGAGILCRFVVRVLEKGDDLQKALEGNMGITFSPESHHLVFQEKTSVQADGT
ncbi:cytochrome P450 306a1 isoform X2 [Cimex lectularius]|uniref:Cytochrome P450 n=1 Tax=Cimex lectularius TaxID=79782 RepID=A0A8I6SCX3_CIMLE|nr:cytochrome P450 306a1 isoform X2 [Cimex lectularius]